MPGSAARASARPFPWASLDTTTHSAVEAHRALRRFASHVHASSIARAFEAVTGARIDVRLRRVDAVSASESATRALRGGVALSIEDAGARDDAPSSPVLFEVEPELATALVASALRRAPARLPVPAPSLRIAGALAAIVNAALRRAEGPRASFRVIAAGSATDVWSTALWTDAELVVATLTVLVGDDAFLARVAMTSAALSLLPTASGLAVFDAARLASLGNLRLAIPVVLAASLASQEELALLDVGDAWMPAGAAMRTRHALSGRVFLAVPTCERAVIADLGDDGRIVVREGFEDLSMTDNVVVENAAEATVVVRVEVGAVELPAREWAAVVPGDVLTLARRVADPVVLRAGGVEIARGELVEIEGEIGVRILSRTGAST